ncbi:MAG: hypothetical protein COX81_03795 [Candidatus Magasanikbacteria bacterium CG_4_10_14_0_2_um_filter_37_12]|uniref:Uncharacterized protein n=1 Tax=Candidatus Magasanikbacteria bacterium CG_4_10_14_0_2_um_filter_37_12 TaxID=1974637 RepID=A0A2M7V6M8_9BACT|nr:MAG: hypothetical protein COX81_03795 [Candidatus Magasanikbacteria bacterium CG_4_10_14_0_2_um_filter_37_12]
MLNKVLKKLKEAEKKSGDASTKTYQNLQVSSQKGFHAKNSSPTGAKRQRSVGNRGDKGAR